MISNFPGQRNTIGKRGGRLRNYMSVCSLFFGLVSSSSIASDAARNSNHLEQVNPGLTTILFRMQTAESQQRNVNAYEVVREYRLFKGTDSRPNSEVLVDINNQIDDGLTYSIRSRSGSGRGEQVVRRILDKESVIARGSELAQFSLSEANYAFTYLGEAQYDGHPCYLLGLKPKRKDVGLLEGKAFVDKSLYLVRQIEGEMVQLPSWWLKAVTLRMEFSDQGGTWIQTSMEAVADVRLVGRHTLKSQTVDFRPTSSFAKNTSPNPKLRQGMKNLPASLVFLPPRTYKP